MLRKLKPETDFNFYSNSVVGEKKRTSLSMGIPHCKMKSSDEQFWKISRHLVKD